MCLICFNPRSPRRERLRLARELWDIISFQSTLPSQGATRHAALGELYRVVSIHAPLAGSDSAAESARATSSAFQSTLPSQGATASTTARAASTNGFQSTLPSQGATGVSDFLAGAERVSIHAPLAGSDLLRFG